MNGYGKVRPVGHPDVRDLIPGTVDVEEKIDGSQFSFGVDVDGRSWCRSKNAQLNLENPQAMFAPAVQTVLRLARFDLLAPGVVLYGETLCKPRHNVIRYNRVPDGHIALFDVDVLGAALSREALVEYAAKLGLSVVPLLWHGHIETAECLRSFLSTRSFLGGSAVEGVVVKRRAVWLRQVAKVVSDAFREKQDARPQRLDRGALNIVERVAAPYATPARFAKTVQHLREAGVLQNAKLDIGPLLEEVKRDLLDEYALELHHEIIAAALPAVLKRVVRDLPEWYIAKLEADKDPTL